MDARGAIWTLGRMNARSDGRTVLSVVWTYSRGPSDLCFANRISDVRQGTGRTLLFRIPSG